MNSNLSTADNGDSNPSHIHGVSLELYTALFNMTASMAQIFEGLKPNIVAGARVHEVADSHAANMVASSGGVPTLTDVTRVHRAPVFHTDNLTSSDRSSTTTAFSFGNLSVPFPTSLCLHSRIGVPRASAGSDFGSTRALHSGTFGSADITVGRSSHNGPAGPIFASVNQAGGHAAVSLDSINFGNISVPFPAAPSGMDTLTHIPTIATTTTPIRGEPASMQGFPKSTQSGPNHNGMGGGSFSTGPSTNTPRAGMNFSDMLLKDNIFWAADGESFESTSVGKKISIKVDDPDYVLR